MKDHISMFFNQSFWSVLSW